MLYNIFTIALLFVQGNFCICLIWSSCLQVLNDKEKRKTYDAHGEEGLKNSGGGGDPFDPFSRLETWKHTGRALGQMVWKHTGKSLGQMVWKHTGKSLGQMVWKHSTVHEQRAGSSEWRKTLQSPLFSPVNISFDPIASSNYCAHNALVYLISATAPLWVLCLL